MRHDAVIIRKSSDPQEEKSQIEGINSYLDRKHISVPQEYWFIDTGSRHKSDQREEFQRLLQLVTQGKIGTVFCWMQDRMGTTDPDEWGHFRWTFRSHGSKIVEAYSDKDLTAKDTSTIVTTMFAADASEKKQFDISRDTMRAKVSLAKEGMPLSKIPPYGFDKRYTDSRGGHLWTTHLLDSGRWLVINPDGSRVERERSPRKSKSDRIAYIPSLDKDRQDLIREIFRMADEEAISHRGIALRLNTSGRTHYGRPWLRTTILEILRNPAYVGTVRFNRTTQAEFTLFDGEKQVEVANPGRKGKKKTRPGVPIYVEGRHPGLVEREVFDRVQTKLKHRKSRPQPPRREDLWLAGVLYCAGCGKKMRTFTGQKGSNQRGYICGSYYRYQQSRSRLDYTGCPRSFIGHDTAEGLIRKELGDRLNHSNNTTEVDELRLLGKKNHIDRMYLMKFIAEGTGAYLEHLTETIKRAGKTGLARIKAKVEHLKKSVKDHDLKKQLDEDFPDLPELRKYFILFEEERTKAATGKMEELKEEYDRLVVAKSFAKSDREREVFDRTLARLEAEIAEWEEQAVGLDDRLAELRTRLDERKAHMRAIGKAMTGSNHLRKAELVRGVFEKVILHFRPVKKKVYTDSVFEADKTEFISALEDKSCSRKCRASSPAGRGCPSMGHSP
jgi:DNA invertase Pin-like site-specific DNA recombinase